MIFESVVSDASVCYISSLQSLLVVLHPLNHSTRTAYAEQLNSSSKHSIDRAVVFTPRQLTKPTDAHLASHTSFSRVQALNDHDHSTCSPSHIHRHILLPIHRQQTMTTRSGLMTNAIRAFNVGMRRTRGYLCWYLDHPLVRVLSLCLIRNAS